MKTLKQIHHSFDDVGTVSATALYLLKSLKEDKIMNPKRYITILGKLVFWEDFGLTGLVICLHFIRKAEYLLEVTERR